MEQNTVPENQAPQAPKKHMSEFIKAFLWTGGIFIALGLLSLGVTFIGTRITGGVTLTMLLSIGSAAFFIGAIVAAIVFAVKGKKKIMAGILAGLGIGIVAQGLSCLALIIVIES